MRQLRTLVAFPNCPCPATPPSDISPNTVTTAPSNRGYVRLESRTFYTGPWGTDEARGEYDRLLREWLAHGRSLPPPPSPALTVSELLVNFWRWAKEQYKPNAAGHCEAENYKAPMRMLRQLYGRSRVEEFAVAQLEAVRHMMVEAGWKRPNINRQVNRVRRIFAWGMARDLVPPDNVTKLRAMEPLRRGGLAAEAHPVRPVPPAHVEAIREHVSRQAWGLVQLQVACGGQAR